MERVTTDPDAWLRSLPDPAGEELRRLDALISGAMPGRRRDLWRGVFWGGSDQTILGYGDLVQPRPRGEAVEWFVVGLAQQKRHLSVYVNAVADGRYVLADHAGRLGRVKVGSASITLTRADDLDPAAFTGMLAAADAACPPDR